LASFSRLAAISACFCGKPGTDHGFPRLYTVESETIQKRIKTGYEDVPAAFTVPHKLTDERAAVERLRALVTAKHYQRWGALGGAVAVSGWEGGVA